MKIGRLAVRSALACGFAVLAAGPGIARANDATGRIRIGTPFPADTFPTVDGGRWSIDDERGRRVILHVYASW